MKLPESTTIIYGRYSLIGVHPSSAAVHFVDGCVPQDAGLQDGELLILEDLHDLFLGNLVPQMGLDSPEPPRALVWFSTVTY